MNIKTFNNSCFTPKGDYEANWNKAIGYVPHDKEIIIYKPDAKHSVARIKIGDGVTTVQNLPFVTEVEGLATEEWVKKQSANLAELMQQYTNNAVSGLATVEYVGNATQGLATEEYVDNAVAAIDLPEVDQIFNAESENAQSGRAINEALLNIEEAVIDSINSIDAKNNEQDDKIAELEGRITVVTFNITEANTEVNFI